VKAVQSAGQAFTIGRYQVRGLLGRGGFATVYRAWDPLLNREVALKVLLPHLAGDARLRARFLAEARVIAGLRHPAIAVVHDVGEADGVPFFAMELIDGETLAAACRCCFDRRVAVRGCRCVACRRCITSRYQGLERDGGSRGPRRADGLRHRTHDR
jgi:serine/threonine protein kinase